MTYGDWTTAEWPVVTVPTVDDYTASQVQVSAVTVGSTIDNQTVTVAYQAVEVSTTSTPTPSTTPEAHATVTSHASNSKPLATNVCCEIAGSSGEGDTIATDRGR